VRTTATGSTCQASRVEVKTAFVNISMVSQPPIPNAA
jgi:hypothetical protein